MADLTIKTIFRAIDKMSGPIKSMQSKVSLFSNKSAKAFKKFGGATKKITKGVGSFFKKLAIGAAIVTGLTIAVFGFVKAGVDFEKTISNVAAKFGEITPDKLLELEEVARRIGAETEFSATQAGEGLEFLAMAGFNAEQAISSLPLVVDLATASNLDLARATDIASDTLGAFNMMTEDTVQLQTNLSRVNDVMAKTVTSSNTNMEQLFETFTKAGPIATSLGQSIETVAALTGKLGDAGIKGSIAGTTLKNVFTRLAAPTGAAADRIKELGLEISDSQGNFRDIMDIMGDLQSKIGMKGATEQAAILSDIFGKIPLAGVNVLLSTGSDALKEYREELIKSNGAAKEMAKIMRDNVAGQVKSLQSRFEAVRITSFKILAPTIQKALNVLIKLTSGFDTFLQKNEKLIQSGITRTIEFLTAGFKELVNIFNRFNSAMQGSVFLTKMLAVLKDLFFSLLPIINNIFNEIIKIIGLAAKFGVFTTIVKVFKEIAKTTTFIVQKIVEFIQHLNKIGAIEFLVKAFTLLLNIIKIILKIMRPIVSLIFGIAKVLLTALTPVFKLLNLVLGGINKLMGTKSGFEQPTVTPNENIIESNTTQTNRSEVDVTFNNAPSGTRISQRGLDNNIKLNTGRQRGLQPGT